MSNPINTPSTQDIAKGLEVVELEQRLEMVHLTAVEADASNRCDIGGDSAALESAPEPRH